jgi:hypothetical protein
VHKFFSLHIFYLSSCIGWLDLPHCTLERGESH